MSIASSDDVLAFWFGTLNEQGGADAAHSARWWAEDPVFDEQVRQQFLSLHEAVCAREREDWLGEPTSNLAYVVVLDQFSRNMFRGTERMFASDGQALAAAEQGITRGHDRALAFDQRNFLYMPFMHSEQLSDQERSVKLFTQLRDEAPRELRDGAIKALEAAERHREIVQRFGRFPHRNVALERTSTAYELEYLLKPVSAF